HQLRSDEKRLMTQRLQLSGDDYADLVRKSHLFVAHQPAKLLAFQLEDLLLMETPVNIPGTSTEYTNWQRKLVANISDILASEAIISQLQSIRAARQ
ncbi:MAG TPA: 4-alpha-glucanotransferase, partial [Rheinheimera sp.]|nr:4-alpha-glucanotransferase [Rheinheimera sp.]